MTLYSIKPQFQSLLRPIVKWLAAAGVTANQVTVAATFISVLVGGILWLGGATGTNGLFLLLPIWLFLRMALNAIDGMLARECGQVSTLGGFLNEITDPVSDAALTLPFAALAGFRPELVVVVVILAILTEMAGVTARALGGARRYDGPMGKSDRALMFGALGAWLGAGQSVAPVFANLLCGLLSVLLVVTIVNRVRRAVDAIDRAS